jgi:cell division protein FtsZ
MMKLTSSQSLAGRRLKLIAAGNAGINLLDRIFLETGGELEAAALHTEAQSLNASAAPERVLCGERTTRGLGAGGDPALGAQALEESRDKVAAVLEEADAVILLGGLGGGTAGPVLEFLAAEAARRDVPALALVTLPFSFEGPRRTEQARASLDALRQSAGLVAAFPNEGMSQLGEVGTPVTEAFARADAILIEAVRGLVEILRGRGPMEITARDLLGHVGHPAGEVFFSTASARGGNRANEVVPKLWKCPLRQSGPALDKVRSLLVHVSAGPDLTLSEVRAVVDQVRREFEEEALHLYLGMTTSSAERQQLAVTLIGSLKSSPSPAGPMPAQIPAAAPKNSRSAPLDEAVPLIPKTAPVAKAAPAREEIVEPIRGDELDPATRPEDGAPVVAEEESTEIPAKETTFDPPAEEEPAPEKPELKEPPVSQIPSEVAPSPSDSAGGLLPNFPQIPAVSRPPARPVKKPPVKNRQEVLPLEVAARGRFERSEPTIEEGEDLDVPTFIRLRIKIK